MATQKQKMSLITNSIICDMRFYSKEYTKAKTKGDRLFAWGALCVTVKVFNQLNGGHDPRKNKDITSAYEQVVAMRDQKVLDY
jgi:hypothetical protein